MWLDARQDADVLPGLTYLRNGHTVDIHDRRGGQIRVGGVLGGAMAHQTTCVVPDDCKVMPSATTRQMRLHGLPTQAVWTSC